MERRLKSSQIFRYTLYSFASGFGNLFPLSYLNVYLTNQMKINPTVLASLLLVPRIIDFFMGAFAGALIQKFNLKGGKYRPFLMIFSLSAVTGTVLQFSNTSSLPYVARLAIVFVGYTMLHCSMDFISVAQYGSVALLGGTSQTDRQRLTIAGIRVSTAVGVFTSATTVPIITYLSGTSLGPLYAYTIPATVYGLIYLAGLFNLASLIKPYDLQDTSAARSRTVTLTEMAKAIATNGQLLTYVGAATLLSICNQAISGIQAYYFIYVLGDFNLMAWSLTITRLVGLVSTTIGPVIGKKLGKRRAYIATLFLGAATRFGIILLGAKGVIYYIVLMSFNSVSTAISSGFGANYIIDCAEYGYWKSGKDNRAVSMAMSNMPIKIGMFVGGTIGLYGLSLAGFDASLPAQTAAFSTSFMYLFGGMPFVFNLLAGFLFLFGYKISDEDAAKYALENAERKALEASQATTS